MVKPDTSAFITVLSSARNISILVPQKPSFDHISAALGLKLSLTAAGKEARVISPDPVLVEFNRLVGVDTITNSFGSRDLVIALPGQTEYVDKVSYNLDQGELQLVITPKPDSPELDHRQLKFIPGVNRTDLLITVGVKRLSDLGPIRDQAGGHFSSTTSMSLSHQTIKEKFATHELHDPEASCLSELVTHILDTAGLKLDEDPASNLLAGLEKATDSFRHPAVSLGTFEAAVILMRCGAKRHFELSASGFPPGSIPQISLPDPDPQDSPVAKTSSASASGYGTDGHNSNQSAGNGKKAPADWYEPKVFKGPMLP